MAQKCPSFYRARKLFTAFTNTPPLISIINKINPVIVGSYISKIHFKIILSSTLMFGKPPIPFKILGVKFYMHFTRTTQY